MLRTLSGMFLIGALRKKKRTNQENPGRNRENPREVQGGGKQTGGNDICAATGVAVQCRRDTRRQQRTGKRLSRTMRSSFNKGRMSHLRDSTVAGPIARGER